MAPKLTQNLGHSKVPSDHYRRMWEVSAGPCAGWKSNGAAEGRFIKRGCRACSKAERVLPRQRSPSRVVCQLCYWKYNKQLKDRVEQL